MKRDILKEKIKFLINEILLLMVQNFRKQKLITKDQEISVEDDFNLKEIVEIRDCVFSNKGDNSVFSNKGDNSVFSNKGDAFFNNNINLFNLSSSNKSKLHHFVFTTALYKEILKLLILKIQRKDWYSVYACVFMLYKFKNEFRIGINLEKLQFIKESLVGEDVYRRLSFLIFNRLLEEKAFVVVEEYKEFEIEIEYNRLLEEYKEIGG